MIDKSYRKSELYRFNCLASCAVAYTIETSSTKGANDMKAFPTYEAIPKTAVYLGSEHGDGSIEEATADAIADAIEPAFFKDEDGQRHYFDLVD